MIVLDDYEVQEFRLHAGIRDLLLQILPGI